MNIKVMANGIAIVLTNLAKCQMVNGIVCPVLNTYTLPVEPTGQTSYTYGG